MILRTMAHAGWIITMLTLVLAALYRYVECQSKVLHVSLMILAGIGMTSMTIPIFIAMTRELKQAIEKYKKGE